MAVMKFWVLLRFHLSVLSVPLCNISVPCAFAQGLHIIVTAITEALLIFYIIKAVKIIFREHKNTDNSNDCSIYWRRQCLRKMNNKILELKRYTVVFICINM